MHFNKWSGKMEPDEEDFENPLLCACLIAGIVSITILAAVMLVM